MISTLGEAADAGWRLRLYCRGHKGDAMKKHRSCIEQIDADLPTLIWTRGRACPISALSGRLRCPRCGSLRVTFAFDTSGTPAANQVALRA
jgi:hypothetical protein